MWFSCESAVHNNDVTSLWEREAITHEKKKKTDLKDVTGIAHCHSKLFLGNITFEKAGGCSVTATEVSHSSLTAQDLSIVQLSTSTDSWHITCGYCPLYLVVLRIVIVFSAICLPAVTNGMYYEVQSVTHWPPALSCYLMTACLLYYVVICCVFFIEYQPANQNVPQGATHL